MDNIGVRDKIILDISDSQSMKDIFSRMEPGDKVSGNHWEGTLDEAGEKIAVISIDAISLNRPNEKDMEVKPKKEGEDEPESDSNGPESAAIEVYKNDDGVAVSDNGRHDDNVPTETQPPR